LTWVRIGRYLVKGFQMKTLRSNSRSRLHASILCTYY
jgi:hypothetical protein